MTPRIFAVLSCLMMVACQPAPSTPQPPQTPAVVTGNLVYATHIQPEDTPWLLDVYAPTAPRPAPSIVILHGGGTTKEGGYIQELAFDIAARGAVVFVPNLSPEDGFVLLAQDQGAGIRADNEMTVCAVQYARATAGEYGDPSGKVVLIGHSGGGYSGLWVTLAGDQVAQVWDEIAAQRGGPPQQIECAAGGDTSPLPDALIGYGGAYGYFERARDDDPELTAVVSPTTYAGRNTDIPIRMIVGTRDPFIPEDNQAVYEQLLAAGNEVTWIEIEHGHGLETPARDAIMQALDEFLMK